MKFVKSCLLFGAGFIAGAAVAARVVRDKFRQEAEEEIAEMREYYREKERELKQDDSQPEQQEEKAEDDKKEYEKIVKEKGYVDYGQYNDTEPDKKDEVVDDEYTTPIIIDPEEFGEDPSYDTVTLTYFKDGVLADEVDEEFDPKHIGIENLKIFEEFGARSIYVRDEIEMIDYEIIRDDYAYSEYKFYNLSETRDDKPPHQL